MYKQGANLQQGDLAHQLLNCCDQDLMEMVLRAYPDAAEMSEEDNLQAIKKLAVIPVPLGVRRSSMLNLRQDMGEPIRAFNAKITGKAPVILL